MQSPDATYDAETVALMGRVCDDVWRELQVNNYTSGKVDASDVRSTVALRVLAAVADGERDPERLKSIALQMLDA